MSIFDPFLLEALINGILLGGVFALPVLGLNLVFGVVDVVWLCYAELVMVGMYIVWYLYNQMGWPLWMAFAVCLPCLAVLGVLLHVLVVRPLLTAPPINQVLATGGVLFVLQGGATLVFSTEFRSLGVDMPPMEVWEVFISGTKLSAFIAALVGAALLWLFLKYTYVGTAIRAIARDREVMPLMGVDPRRIYLIASAVGGSLAGLAACLLLVQLDVHPFVGLSFGPITFMICVMGGLGNMLGGFLAAFLMGVIISVGGFWGTTEWSYVFAFLFFIIIMFVRPRGLFAR
ncbi:MAG: branched-chain amino acid ABC transporter permease [Roseomonas sp.]|jgi:branched-chain amino acid transport system permease protein|nr:branched-chain amino acid ABC transporter permease [Roseomonas sp.]MCA3328737.1 branched-chain amino acid ABC transporter permease [Roseomonas sp.]MCA3333071.1 branched-chain amino acid ABC transporter permease [Roseomonas sp.]MCA3335856.1 branched-chain amino acid ABC transporter permease [Roseomonas sp.]MCA3345740.1 branched-chain amino acid ABC transporter permease [Roseomonas sp.]